MSQFFKVSGKKVAIPGASSGDWRFVGRPGGWVIAERLEGGAVVERRKLMLTESRARLGVSVGGRLFQGEVSVAARGGASVGAGDSDLVAQFPGKVRKVLVAEGQEVAEGDPLVLIEAMKMEFSVKAPGAARVSKVLVSEGQQLSPGARFVELEMKETGG